MNKKKLLQILVSGLILLIIGLVLFVYTAKSREVDVFSLNKIHPLTYSGFSPLTGPDYYEAVCYTFNKSENRLWSKNRDDMQVFHVDSEEANLREEWKFIIEMLNDKSPFNPQITISEFQYEEN